MEATRYIKPRVWRAWVTIHPSTTRTPVIKRDDDGQLWAWCSYSRVKVGIAPATATMLDAVLQEQRRILNRPVAGIAK